MRRLIFNKDEQPIVSQLPRQLASKSIIVVGLVKDVQTTIDSLVSFLHMLKSGCRRVWFAYLTNNNTDNTLELLDKLKKENPNWIDGLVLPNEQVIVASSKGVGNRTIVFAQYRNKVIEFAKDWMKRIGEAPDYMLQIDTDMQLDMDLDTFASFLSCPQARPDVICSNGLYKNSPYFYDTFSLRLLDEPNKITEVYPLFERFYGRDLRWLTTVHQFKSWTKVKSAFGGMMLLPRSTYEHATNLYDADIPPDECEHISLCTKFESVYINPHWTIMSNYSLEGHLYSGPIAFIPRDAGFFSVFNFYIGMLTSRLNRVYPVWRISDFKQTHRVQKPIHFCYFSEVHENAWLEYFKPITFFPGDTTMTDNTMCSFPKTLGEEGPSEFRVPKQIAKLFGSPEFATWRKETHAIYKSYVHFSDNMKRYIESKKKTLFHRYVKPVSKPLVGVHYRHPSHSCEEPRPLLLRNYFVEVDDILAKHPLATVFLSTDNEFGVLAFKNKYGSRLVYDKDVQRTPLDNILEWAYARGHGRTDHVGFIDNQGYELHHLFVEKGFSSDLGKEVICDVACLAECDFVIHSVSNIALAVSYINPNAEMIFVGTRT